jgi:hypothetical protein
MYPFCQISTKDVSKQKQKRLNTSLMPIVYNFSKFGPRFTFMKIFVLSIYRQTN